MEMYQAVELVEFLQNEGYEAEIYENYSGRGMYGRTTTGVTTGVTPYSIEYMLEAMLEAGIEPNYRHDSMGLDFIYY